MADSEDKLENVFWLGGSPCAGKSSISEIIASRFGLDVCHVDETFEAHEQRCDPLRHPALTKWSKSSWNQRWMQPVESLVQEASRAIWLIPTADFQRTYYSRRDWVRGILAQCSKPEEAFHNWMQRDIRFAQWIEAEASATHLPFLRVDGDRTIEQNAEAVATHFQLLVHQSRG